MADEKDTSLASRAALAAGAAIGSAAIAAALLFVKRRKSSVEENAPTHPEQANETD